MFNKILTSAMVVTFSLLIVKEYYPQLIIIELLTRPVLILTIALMILVELFASRFLGKDVKVRSEKTSFNFFLYLLCLWIFLNILPGSDSDAAMSFEGERSFIVILVVLFLMEVYQLLKKREMNLEAVQGRR